MATNADASSFVEDVASTWTCGRSAFGNKLRFYAFSIFHLMNSLANATVVVYLCVLPFYVEHTKPGYLTLLIVAQLIVGIYLTSVALLEPDIKNAFGRRRKCRIFACLILGFSQLIQVKVAYKRYQKRERVRQDGNEPTLTIDVERQASLLWLSDQISFDSKRWEGIFEGSVFACVLMYAELKVWSVGDVVAAHMHKSWWVWLLTMSSGTMSFLTVGMSILNLDYIVSPVVREKVDKSLRYTFLHATFRCCEAGSRFVILVLLCLCFRSCGTIAAEVVPYLILFADFATCTCLFFCAGNSAGLNTAKLLCISICEGAASLVFDLTQFAPQTGSEGSCRVERIFSTAIFSVRVFESTMLLVFLCTSLPCKIRMDSENGNPAKDVGVGTFVFQRHLILFLEFAPALVLYCFLRFLFFIDCFGTAIETTPDSVHSEVSLHGSDRNQPLLESPNDALLSEQPPSAPSAGQSSDVRPPNVGGSFYYAREETLNRNRQRRKSNSMSFPVLLFAAGCEQGFVKSFGLPVIGEDTEETGQDAKPRVSFGDFEELGSLGRGGFSDGVVKCKKKDSGRIFAMKKITKTCLQTKLGYREKILLQKAHDHPNIEYLQCAFEDTTTLYLILEFCDLGSLTLYMEESFKQQQETDGDDAERGLEPDHVRRIGLDVLEGLHHLHDLGILHRDVKRDNIGICSGEVKAKLIDFGLSNSVDKSHSCVGTHLYAAPEMTQPSSCFYQDARIDLYSFGVLLFTALVGLEPNVRGMAYGKKFTRWANHKEFRQMLASRHAELWFCPAYEEADICGHTMYDALEECSALASIKQLTETEPYKRVPTATAAKELPFFVFTDQGEGISTSSNEDDDKDEEEMDASASTNQEANITTAANSFLENVEEPQSP